ncbi:MAG: ABC transporter permease [Pseudomonadota bacterium]
MSARTRDPGPESPLRVHLRVVSALLRREMSTRYGRSSAGYVWAVAEPCGMILVMSFAFSALQRAPDLGQSFIVFFATGFLSFNFYRDTAGQLFNTVRQNRALLKYPNVNVYDALIARLTLQTLTNCLVALLVLSAAAVATGERLRPDFAQIGPALAAATLLGLGAGTVNAVLFPLFPNWERIFLIVNRPLFIVSAVLYTPESMPGPIRDLLAFNPLAHVVSVFRAGLYPVYSPRLDMLAYPALLGLGLLFLGLLLLRRHDERLLER